MIATGAFYSAAGIRSLKPHGSSFCAAVGVSRWLLDDSAPLQIDFAESVGSGRGARQLHRQRLMPGKIPTYTHQGAPNLEAPLQGLDKVGIACARRILVPGERGVPANEPALELCIPRYYAFSSWVRRRAQIEVDMVNRGMKTPRTPVTVRESPVYGFIDVSSIEDALIRQPRRVEFVLGGDQSETAVARVIREQCETGVPADAVPAPADRSDPIGAVAVLDGVRGYPDPE